LDVCPTMNRFTWQVMGFSWVQIIVPIPQPVLKPTQNPWVYPYPCRSLPASHLETVNDFTDWMHSTLMEAKATLAKAREDMTHYYN